MTNFFYYSVAKRPEEMDTDELVREIHSALAAAHHAAATGSGISTKETVRKRACEMALVKLPGGIDRWNEEFACENRA